MTAHIDNKNFKIVQRNQVPKNIPILPAMWVLMRKRRISTSEVFNWKDHLSIDGSKKIEGIHYDESFSAVASWATIRTTLELSVANNWYTVHIDFVQEFSQAPVEREIYMQIPKGF